jgi:hypothetical protein
MSLDPHSLDNHLHYEPDDQVTACPDCEACQCAGWQGCYDRCPDKHGMLIDSAMAYFEGGDE